MTKLETYGSAFSPEDIAYYQAQQKKKVLLILSKCLIYFVLCVWAFFAIFPLIWIVLSSFKFPGRIEQAPINPDFGKLTFDNYKALFAPSTYNILNAFLGSIWTSVVIVICVLIIAILAGFALARLKFRGHKIFEAFIVGCMMFPSFALIMPIYMIYRKLDLDDTKIGYILPQIALNISFSTILLTGFFKSLPIEVEESAFLDGASVIRILVQIILPMMKSALITSVIFVFLWSYNDMFVQSLVIKESKKMLLGSLVFEVSRDIAGPSYGKGVAAATFVAFPMMVIYFFLQKHIIKGLTAGAVKG